MIFYKLLALVFIAAFVILVLRIRYLGKKLSRGRKNAGWDDWSMLQQHRSAVSTAHWFALVVVVFVELAVRSSPDPYTGSLPLLGFHLFIVAILLIIATTMIGKYTGLFNPNVHRRLGYAYFMLVSIMVATGVVLLYMLPTEIHVAGN